MGVESHVAETIMVAVESFCGPEELRGNADADRHVMLLDLKVPANSTVNDTNRL
jgi:hypothetical protein